MSSDLIERLMGLAKAYPEDIFPPVTSIEVIELGNTYPGIVGRLSGAMGRHLSQFFAEAATALAAKDAEIERERSRADALAAEVERLKEALHPFAEVVKHDIGADEYNDDRFQPMHRHNKAPLLTVGDLLRARAALHPQEGEK